MGYICEGGKRESEHAPLLAAETVVRRTCMGGSRLHHA